jgi:hypothetical protein
MFSSSQPFDFVNGSVPRNVNVYTVPTGYLLVLDSIDVVTQSVTNQGTNPTITIGTATNTTAYEQTHQQGTAGWLWANAPQNQTVPAGTTITATVTANATSTAQSGIVVINGYLIPATGSIPEPPTPPSPSSFVGIFYTVDPGGNAVAGVTINYACTHAPCGSGEAFDSTPHSTISDGTGLASIPMQPGATYRLWNSVLAAPTVVCVPATATSPYSLPNWVYLT